MEQKALPKLQYVQYSHEKAPLWVLVEVVSGEATRACTTSSTSLRRVDSSFTGGWVDSSFRVDSSFMEQASPKKHCIKQTSDWWKKGGRAPRRRRSRVDFSFNAP